MSRARNGLMLCAPLALLLIGFFLLPVLLMLPTGFREYVPGAGIATGSFTLENYTSIITDGYYREVIGRTLDSASA